MGSAAGHGSAGALDLREDLALVKASLLYADRVKLCSVGSSMLSGIAKFEEASPEARARLVVRFLPDLQPSMSPQEIRLLLRGRLRVEVQGREAEDFEENAQEAPGDGRGAA